MVYPDLSLGATGLIVALLLIIGHAAALAKAGPVQAALRTFPRSRFWGVALMIAAGLWGLLLVTFMDLGEFSSFRRVAQVVVIAATILMAMHVEEFLAVRALGMLLLLAAEPLVEASFLKPQASRLLLVALAYAWVLAGLCWVGMPYLLRDQVAWVTRTVARWRSACVAGMLWGAALLICSLTQYR
jgi:hypothetical protein